MHALKLLSVYLHLFAAIVWVGGMSFLVLVVVPWLRSGTVKSRIEAGRFLRETGKRFRNVGWTCFAILVVTGTFQLYSHGIRPGSFVDLGFHQSTLGRVIIAKLVCFTLVLIISGIHDFGVGPAATRAIDEDPQSEQTQFLRSLASRLGRLNALLALVLVALGVVIVRGLP